MTRIALLACFLAGCARFIDERPAPSDLASDDAAPAPPDSADLAPVTNDAGDTVLATGMFVQGIKNGGDTGSGSVVLERGADGVERVVFGDDFSSTPLPAGEVILTSRTAIGQGGIQPVLDIDLGRLRSATGAQTYALPGDDGGRRNVFVYCVTYGIDVAIGALK
jgi:hypothetical protein